MIWVGRGNAGGRAVVVAGARESVAGQHVVVFHFAAAVFHVVLSGVAIAHRCHQERTRAFGDRCCQIRLEAVERSSRRHLVDLTGNAHVARGAGPVEDLSVVVITAKADAVLVNIARGAVAVPAAGVKERSAEPRRGRREIPAVDQVAVEGEADERRVAGNPACVVTRAVQALVRAGGA